MSSETSTNSATFRPWHLFVLAGLLASTVGVVVVRPSDVAVLVLLVLAIGSASGVGLALYHALWPLVSPDVAAHVQTVGGRTRAALAREKTLVLRSIKELEFDRAMSKVSDEDFREMASRLRTRALTLMQQLDVDQPGYRALIEKLLAERLGVDLTSGGQGEPIQAGDTDTEPDRDGAGHLPACVDCGTDNDPDARFCKNCGASLEASR